MALSDKVEALQEKTTIHFERICGLEKTATKVEAAIIQIRQSVADLQRELALLRQSVEKDFTSLQSWKAEQKKREEEWGRRAWSFGPNLVAAVL